VQTYTDGSTALDDLKSNPPDLAIFDIKVPRMDGVGAPPFRQKSDVPVIFNLKGRGNRRIVRSNGRDDFVRKPF
jgi:two-component system response regulator ChvI